jgi:type II secretory pathway pseudopilin PulG
MKLILGMIALALLIAIAVAILFVNRNKARQQLTADEQLILDAVREVYGDHITNESIAYSNGDATLALGLREERVSTLNVNLSSLARKHRDEGLTLPAIKMSLKF